MVVVYVMHTECSVNMANDSGICYDCRPQSSRRLLFMLWIRNAVLT